MSGVVVVDVDERIRRRYDAFRGSLRCSCLFISMIDVRYVALCILLLLSVSPIVIVVFRLVFVNGRFLSVVSVL